MTIAGDALELVPLAKGARALQGAPGLSDMDLVPAAPNRKSDSTKPPVLPGPEPE